MPRTPFSFPNQDYHRHHQYHHRHHHCAVILGRLQLHWERATKAVHQIPRSKTPQSSWGVCNFTGRGQQRPYTRSPAARPHRQQASAATSTSSASSSSGWLLRELVRCLVHHFSFTNHDYHRHHAKQHQEQRDPFLGSHYSLSANQAQSALFETSLCNIIIVNIIALSFWGVCNFTGRGQQRPYTMQQCYGSEAQAQML